MNIDGRTAPIWLVDVTMVEGMDILKRIVLGELIISRDSVTT